MGTIFFFGYAAGSTESNGQWALELDAAAQFGRRAAGFHGKPVNGVICARDDHALNVGRAFLKAHGTTYMSVSINGAPEVVGRGLDEAFDQTFRAGEEDSAHRRTSHIRQEIVRLIGFAVGSTAYAVLVVAPLDLLQPILHRLHTRWQSNHVAPPSLDPCQLVVVNVDAAKPIEGRKNSDDFIVSNFKMVSPENGASPNRAGEPTIPAAAAPAV